MRCIYCLQEGSRITTFASREHVIPASLGLFSPLNPTLINHVCDNCNSKIFSPLEANFIEDSFEGLYAQKLDLNGRGSVIMRAKNLQIERIEGFGDGFFDEMFFFLRAEGRRLAPYFRAQIKLRHYKGGYRVFLPEALKRIQRGSKRFEKISSELKKLDQKDIKVFAPSSEELNEAIELLRTFGVPYKEKESRGQPLQTGEKLTIHEEYTVRINADIGRVLAKISFNYFAYCTQQSGKEDILFGPEFNRIRAFINSGIGVLKDIIPSIKEEPILDDEHRENMRVIMHLINFRIENRFIIARMTFFGLSAIYKIILGKIPDGLNSENFGCAHAFDPFNRSIMNLSNRPPLTEPTADQVRASFGLFNRFGPLVD